MRSTMSEVQNTECEEVRVTSSEQSALRVSVVCRFSAQSSCLGEDWAAVERSLIMKVVQLGGGLGTQANALRIA